MSSITLSESSALLWSTELTERNLPSVLFLRGRSASVTVFSSAGTSPSSMGSCDGAALRRETLLAGVAVLRGGRPLPKPDLFAVLVARGGAGSDVSVVSGLIGSAGCSASMGAMAATGAEDGGGDGDGDGFISRAGSMAIGRSGWMFSSCRP